MNSTVTVRVASAVPMRAALAVLSCFWSPMPVTWHSTRYSGTSAKPKAKLPATNSHSLSVRLRLALRWPASSFNRRSGAPTSG